MNRLHQLLETPASHWKVPPGISNEQARCVASYLNTYGRRAVCFWLGEVSALPQITPLWELLRLPYETCWFEMQMTGPDGGFVVGCLCDTIPDGVGFCIFHRIGNDWMLISFAQGNSLGGQRWGIVPTDECAVMGLDVCRWAIGAFLTAMSCNNVRKSRTDPEAKLQRARTKRGKLPLFSYWTLELTGRSDSSESQGGNHSSPRVHLRRGHPRQYAEGRWTWVTHSIVGNKASGIVHKDYSYRSAQGLGS